MCDGVASRMVTADLVVWPRADSDGGIVTSTHGTCLRVMITSVEVCAGHY